MKKRKELLEKHPYSIWEGKDGYWRTHIPDEKSKEKRKLIKKHTREEVEDIVVEYWRKQENNFTIEEVFNEWNDRRLNLKKISNATHLRNKQTFKRHYSEFGKTGIQDLTPEILEDFLVEQIPKFDLTSKGFSNLKTITKGMMIRAKKRGLISFNVMEFFNELDVSDSDFKKTFKEDYEEVFDEEETDIMIDYLKNNLDMRNLAILIMFVTGVRVGEVVSLKHSDFYENTFNVRRTETRYEDENGKFVYGVKEFPKSEAGVRTVIIPEGYAWITKKVKATNPFSDYIFEDNGRRINTQSLRLRLYRICEKLNIYRKSPHKIRKTYGTILLDNNVDQRLIVGQMGHADILCTEKYYHRNRRTIEQKSKILSSIPDLMAK